MSNGTKITFLAADYEMNVTYSTIVKRRNGRGIQIKGNVIARRTVNLDLTKRRPN